MGFDDSDLVMYKKDGKMYGGGFTVNSIMMHHGISPITRVSGKKTGGGTGTIHDSFSHLAIPAGLYYFETGLVVQSGGGTNVFKEEEYVSDDMHSTLMNLAGNVADEYVGGADSDSHIDEDAIVKSSDKKKHKKTKKHPFGKKGRQTRKH
jgi:hypothetical protein